MSISRRILLIHAPEAPAKAGTAIDLARLREALVSRGAQVDELNLGDSADALLDGLAQGALPVVLRGDAHR